MQEPILYYQQEINRLKIALTALKKQLLTTNILRFIAFLLICFSSYSGFAKNNLFFIASFLSVIIFTYLVSKNQQLKQQKELTQTKLNINETEIEVLKGHYSHLDNGEEFINPAHDFSHDIDLFGNGSFFQYINRTATDEGKKLLAHTLTSNTIKDIEKRQKVTQELALKTTWRQHFTALASLINTKTAIAEIVNWVQEYQPKLPPFLSLFSYIFSAISLALIGLFSFSIIPFSMVVSWFIIGLFITAFYIKNIQELSTQTSRTTKTFTQYYQLLAQIENQEFTHSTLKEKQLEIQYKHSSKNSENKQENKKASDIFKEFSKKLDAFDQRGNVMIALLGNGLFLMDIRNTIKIENWIKTYKNTVKQWFEVVSFFDAQNSLANFVFNKPEYVFPEIIRKNIPENIPEKPCEKAILNATNLGHPLLNASKRIDNDFIIDTENFFIITGANMAGKSTFLRSISLAIVMSNVGLPICAEKVSYTPIKLITSMRTSDSLNQDESYFYAELKRLKFIVNQIKNDNYFIILDEILKGTNSQDKAIGSKKFVEKLNKSKSTGIIATHDVSLCDLSEQYNSIHNYYFDAEIIKNELHFDYKMKTGICKNMNASFLLKKMEIV